MSLWLIGMGPGPGQIPDESAQALDCPVRSLSAVCGLPCQQPRQSCSPVRQTPYSSRPNAVTRTRISAISRINCSPSFSPSAIFNWPRSKRTTSPATRSRFGTMK